MSMNRFDSVAECDEYFSNTSGVRIVKWGSAYCSPCKMLNAVLKGAISSGKVDGVVEIDTDVNPDVLVELQLTAVPYSRVYLDGEFKGSLSGVYSEKMLDDLLNPPAVE